MTRRPTKKYQTIPAGPLRVLVDRNVLRTPDKADGSKPDSLPKGYRTDLPDPAHVKRNFANVDKIYRFDGKELVIERTIVVLAPKLAKAEWTQYKTFAKDSGFDGEPWIQLIQPALSEPPRTQAELTPPHIARGPQRDKATAAANPADATTAETASANELIERVAADQGRRPDRRLCVSGSSEVRGP